jgi:hypothetical protein
LVLVVLVQLVHCTEVAVAVAATTVAVAEEQPQTRAALTAVEAVVAPHLLTQLL